MTAISFRYSTLPWALAHDDEERFRKLFLALMGFVIIFGIALTFQGLAWISGSLYVPMVVHAVYDIIAGLHYGYFGRKLGYPVEPLPA